MQLMLLEPVEEWEHPFQTPAEPECRLNVSVRQMVQQALTC